MKPTLFLLAAGMGSRFGGLKQIEKIGPNGEKILDFSIYDAKQAGFESVIFIIKKEMEQDLEQESFRSSALFMEQVILHWQEIFEKKRIRLYWGQVLL